MKINRIVYGAAAACMMLGAFTACGDKESGSSGTKIPAGHETPQDALEAFYAAYNTHDARKVYEAAFPQEIIDELEKKNPEKYSELISEYQRMIDQFTDFYGDFTIEYEVQHKSKWGKEEREKAQEYINEIYEAAGIKDVPEVTGVYYFDMKYYPIDPEKPDKKTTYSNNVIFAELDNNGWYDWDNFI